MRNSGESDSVHDPAAMASAAAATFAGQEEEAEDEEESSTATISIALRLAGSKDQIHEPTECRQANVISRSSFSTANSNNNNNNSPAMATSSMVRLEVSLPYHLVELKHASKGADLLLQAMDDMGQNCSVEQVEVIDLPHFTSSGLDATCMFLAIHAPSVKRLALQRIILKDDDDGEEEKEVETKEKKSKSPKQQLKMLTATTSPLVRLATTFQESRLEALDLSGNRLDGEECSHIWSAFGKQTQLQNLQLNSVTMNPSAVQQLEQALEKQIYTGSLTALSISHVMEQQLASDQSGATTSKEGVEAANNILYRCTNLRQLQWEFLPPTSHDGGNAAVTLTTITNAWSLPCRGICDLAQRMFRLQTHLRHLQLEGAQLETPDLNSLCGALQVLTRLTQLSLRRMALTPEQMNEIVLAIKMGRAPLQVLDLSNNVTLGEEGAKALGQVAAFRSLQMSLETLNIENIGLRTNGAIHLFSTLAANGMEKITVTLGRNPMVDMSRVALTLAAGSSGPQNHDRKNVKSLLAAQSTMLADMQELQRRIEQLTKDKETLMGAFVVLGATKAVEERKSVLERLSNLEEAVHKGGNRGKDRGGHSSHHSSNRQHRSDPRSNAMASSMQSDHHSNNRQHRIDERSNAMTSSFHSDLESMASSHHNNKSRSSTRRPSAIKSSQETSTGSQHLSRNEVRARVLAEVASLQSKRNEVREAILTDIAALRSRQRPLPRSLVVDNQEATGEAERPRRPSSIDRTEILADIAALRKNNEKRNKLGMNSEDSETKTRIPPPQRQDSLRLSSNRSVEDVTDIASGPEVTLPDASFHSVGSSDHFPGTHSMRERPDPAERFHAILHRQIQNQFFRTGPGGRDEAMSKGGSQRSLDIANSSHHRQKHHHHHRGGGPQPARANNPSLSNFLEREDSGSSRYNSSSASLPAPDSYRKAAVALGLRATKEEDEDNESRESGSVMSMPVIDRSSMYARGAERRGVFQKATSLRALGGARGSVLRTYSGQSTARRPPEQERNLFEAYRNRFNKIQSESKLAMTTSVHGERSPSDVSLDGRNGASWHATRDRNSGTGLRRTNPVIAPLIHRNLNGSSDTQT